MIIKIGAIFEENPEYDTKWFIWKKQPINYET